MSVPSWNLALRRLARTQSPQPSRRRRTRLGRDSLLEDRLAPAIAIVGPADGNLPIEHRESGHAFDEAGRALPGNKSIVMDQLLWLYNAYQDRGANWNQPEPNSIDQLRATPGANLQVDTVGRVLVRINARDVARLEPALIRIGFKEVAAAPEAHLMEGWLPISSLSQVEALTGQGLIGVIPVWKPQTQVGLTTSQGDFVMESDRVRAGFPAAYNGAGVKVGVLSDSFNKLTSPITNAAQDVANGDLPGPGNPNGFTTPVQIIQDETAASSDEGRAMLQIVHDVAPGAQLAFATANGGEANFANNIRALANAGAEVIVDDVFYLAEPRFQYGVVAKAVADVTAAGVTYFSSAGNQADEAWETLSPQLYLADLLPNNDPSRPADQGNEIWADMNPSTSAVDVLQTVTVAAQSQVLLLLQWDDPWYTAAGVRSDIDVGVFDTNGVFFASLSGESDNVGNQTPLEVINFANNGGSPVSFQIGLRLFSGPLVGRIRYQDYGGLSINEYASDSPTISAHAGIPEAVGVGAVPYNNQRVREGFTSSGPMTILYDFTGNRLSSPIVSANPQIAAPDKGNTSFFFNGSDPDLDGRPNFSGTSAAAPHAAAVAALIRQVYPGSTPAQVVQRLISSADSDTDAPGFDKYTGWGLIDAYDAIFGTAGDNVGGSFQDNLNSGVLSPQWETYSTGGGRILTTNFNGPVSGSHVILHERYGDTGNTTWTSSRNELTLHVNPNAPGSNGILLVSEKEFDDCDDPMPASWTVSQTGPSDSDGVAFSVDGDKWFRLLSFTGANSTNSYQSLSFDLPAAAAAAGVTLTNNTRIRFQQFGNANFPNDGIAFDNISFGGSTVTIGGGGIVLSPINPVWNFVDQDGDSVAVKFGGNVGTAALTLTNDKGPIQGIELKGTDSLTSSLTISVKHPSGDGRVSLGQVTGSGLKSLSGKAVNLTGAGISLNGYLGSLTLADVLNGADISATGGGATQKSKLTLGIVGNGTDMQFDNAISSLKAISIGDGSITAVSIGTATIQGDFKSDIVLSGNGVLFGKPALASLKVTGNILGSHIDVTGNVNLVSAFSFRDSTLLVGYTGSLDGSGTFGNSNIGTFQIKGTNDGFQNSHVIASSMKSVSLRSVDSTNGGTAFGFIADNAINKLTIGSPPIFTYVPPDGNSKTLDDFEVKIV